MRDPFIAALIIVNILISVWFGQAARKGLEAAIHRQDDRIRKRIERSAGDEDAEQIQELLDRVRTDYEDDDEDLDSSELMLRNPSARKPVSYDD